MSGAGTRLRVKLDVARPRLAAAERALWTAPDLSRGYVAYLVAMEAVVRASVPLLEAARARCAQLAPVDPVAAHLGAYLRRHGDEERGHDVWLREDLAEIEGTTASVAATAQLPDPAVARLVGAQYYWLLHHHPACLLGYVAALEWHPAPPGTAGRLAARTGLPRRAFRTLAHHSQLDPGHGAELLGLLNTLPLSAQLEAAIGVSALYTVDAAAALLERIARAGAERRGERSLEGGGDSDG